MPTDKSRTATYISDELRADLERWAAIEGRSISNFVERLILKAVTEAKAEGILPTDNQ